MRNTLSVRPSANGEYWLLLSAAGNHSDQQVAIGETKEWEQLRSVIRWFQHGPKPFGEFDVEFESRSELVYLRKKAEPIALKDFPVGEPFDFLTVANGIWKPADVWTVNEMKHGSRYVFQNGMEQGQIVGSHHKQEGQYSGHEMVVWLEAH